MCVCFFCLCQSNQHFSRLTNFLHSCDMAKTAAMASASTTSASTFSSAQPASIVGGGGDGGDVERGAPSSSSSSLPIGSGAEPRKLALQIGINYVGTSSELNGCINDVEQECDELVAHCGYDRAHIVVMTDHTPVKPTLRNITLALIDMAKQTHEVVSVEEVWIGYSGHGTYQKDTSGDERDKRDEALVPLDYETAGLLLDDTLQSVLQLMHPRTRVFVKLDACHSGTAADLRYRYVAGKKNVTENADCKVQATVFLLSGCRDDQTSADAYGLADAGKYSGAMTTALWATAKEHGYTLHWWELLKGMRSFLKSRDFDQVPQLGSTLQIDRTHLFMNRGGADRVAIR